MIPVVGVTDVTTSHAVRESSHGIFVNENFQDFPILCSGFVYLSLCFVSSYL